MNITLDKALSSYGSRWTETVEVPIHSLTFKVKFDAANQPTFAKDEIGSTLVMLGASSALINAALGEPFITVVYREKNGTATNLMQRLPLDLAASIAAAGAGDGAIVAATVYDATNSVYKVASLDFKVDLTMTQGAIPLDNDQSVEISLEFQSPVPHAHEMTIYGNEMPLRTNAALSVNTLSVPEDQNIKTFDIKDAKFLILPLFDPSYKLDYLTFTYPNGITVKRHYDELLAEHLRLQDIATQIGGYSYPIGSCALIDNEIAADAIKVEVVAKAGSPARLYSLVHLMLPGIDPKSVDAKNGMLYQ